MKALLVLYAGDLSEKAFEPLLNGKNSIQVSVEQAKMFPGVSKTVLIACDNDFSFLNEVQIEKKDRWTKLSLLRKISELQADFDCIYFAFADCPFLDPVLAGKIAQRHIKYAADYSYADGWSYGLAPEVLSRGTAGILANILGEDDSPVERDILFSVIQKDINAFDIEAEISPVDLRCHRLNFCADSKRNLLLLKNFIDAAQGKLPCTGDVKQIIENKPQILRTLPAFYPIQVYGGCPQECKICPYPLYTNAAERSDYMSISRFEQLLEKIEAFSDDAVIDLSLWGELSLHPEKLELIEKVISRNKLSLIIETSGIGWQTEELEKCREFANNGKIKWIVSLDTIDKERYAKLRGDGFAEALSCAHKLLSLFKNNCYVQAVRLKGEEEDTEKFYRYWKEAGVHDAGIIIQKYDCFCGKLEKKQASDISPVIRKPCWHIMRDMPVLLDGSVPLCREDLAALKDPSNAAFSILGNVFSEALSNIWQKGMPYYEEHCGKNYKGICADCDEYYTFNF